MLKKNISYTDYDGNQRTEDFYFNLTQTELAKFAFKYTNAGIFEYLKSLILTKDTKNMMTFISDLIEVSYGVKSEDGKRFIKDAEATKAFTETEAYSELFMELVVKEDAIANFLIGISPSGKNVDISKANLSDNDVKDFLYGGKKLDEIAKNVNA